MPKAKSAPRTAKPEIAGRRQTVRVVQLGTSVLSALAGSRGRATLSQLATSVRLPPSKAHRYLKALIDSGFVEQEEATGYYRLGAEALCVGLAALAGIDVVAVAAAHIVDLGCSVNETVILSIWANQGATVVHVREPPRGVTVVTRVGSVLPLLSSASGLVFAAFLPPDESKINTRSLSKQAAAVLDDRLRAIRSAGVAAVQSLFFPGIDALAAPVFDAAGRITAVITVLGPTTSFDVSVDGKIARELAATAAAVSARLGYRPR
ncbi:MAG: IclR family transcriptional regulator [Pseudomonadota bacterium]|nr:IclR family transcriptional regulator [Pseudomonadota bacterium]